MEKVGKIDFPDSVRRARAKLSKAAKMEEDLAGKPRDLIRELACGRIWRFRMTERLLERKRFSRKLGEAAFKFFQRNLLEALRCGALPVFRERARVRASEAKGLG
jgi:hypothetical protein